MSYVYKKLLIHIHSEDINQKDEATSYLPLVGKVNCSNLDQARGIFGAVCCHGYCLESLKVPVGVSRVRRPQGVLGSSRSR